MIYHLVLRGDFISVLNRPENHWFRPLFGRRMSKVLRLADLSKEAISAVKPSRSYISQYLVECRVHALLRVNQQIHQEAKPIFYREVTLCLNFTGMHAPLKDPTHPTRSLEFCVGRPLIGLVPNLQLLSINVNFAPNTDWFFDHFPALKRVTFTGLHMTRRNDERYQGDDERCEHEWNENHVRDRLEAIYATRHFNLLSLVMASRKFEIRALCELELQCICHRIYAYLVSHGLWWRLIPATVCTNANQYQQEYQLYELHQDKSISRLPLGYTDMCIGYDSSYSNLVMDHDGYGYIVENEGQVHGNADGLAAL
jgi:hypothetical protein